MSTTARHFSPRASLAALGLKLRRLGLLEAISSHVHVPQKTVRHTPAEKLYDAFVSILSGARGLSEIDTRLRTDSTLQRAFGRSTCAEYSLVQDTLDACTPENVEELRRVVASLFRAHSRAARHDSSSSLHVLDLDMTGPPCGPTAELSRKGYFSKDGIRHGRQLGRVVAGATEEVVADLLFAGNVQLNTALRSLVTAAEGVLSLDRWRRTRTVLRMDSGGGSLGDVNWCLARGYQLHCKDISAQRAAAQAMLTLLGTLAHNVPVWAREWLAAAEPRLKQCGIVRLLRDVLCVSGFVGTDRRGAEVTVVLNRGSTLARLLAGGLRELLQEQSVAVSLGSLSG